MNIKSCLSVGNGILQSDDTILAVGAIFILFERTNEKHI
jgi:hypothetical protein